MEWVIYGLVYAIIAVIIMAAVDVIAQERQHRIGGSKSTRRKAVFIAGLFWPLLVVLILWTIFRSGLKRLLK